MIRYQTGGFRNFFRNLFKNGGKVSQRSMIVAVPNAALTALLVYLQRETEVFSNNQENLVLSNFSIWGGFVSLLSFLVVFRANMANSRFEQGAVAIHSMGAHWFHACSSLMAFAKHSPEVQWKVMRFQNMIIRLFSILHAVALAEIEIEGVKNERPEGADHVRAFFMEVIDCDAIDDESLITLQHSNARVELVFQWIEQFIVRSHAERVIDVPAPLLTRPLAELESGMTDFNVAMEISVIQFPFPFAHISNMALVLHWLIGPFVLGSFVEKWWWAALFSFVQVFTLWALVFIAIELAEPFGTDLNDLDGDCMQKDMNKKLRALVTSAIVPFPTFTNDCEAKAPEDEDDESGSINFFWSMTKEMKASSTLTQSWARVHQVHPDELEIYHRLSEGPEIVALFQTAPPKRSVVDRSQTFATIVSNATFMSQRTHHLASQLDTRVEALENKISESELEDEKWRNRWENSETVVEMGSPPVAVTSSTRRVVVQDSLAHAETRCQQELHPSSDATLEILAPPRKAGNGTSLALLGNDGQRKTSCKLQM